MNLDVKSSIVKNNEFDVDRIEFFQQKILDYYYENGRHDLSFRQTQNPYHIHLSEIMLSQTQVDRVEKYFQKWIDQYPDVSSVVDASKFDLLELWQGLGYNSRVLNFKTACEQIMNEFNGEYPQTKEELMKLKGVGSYVASAICTFSYNQDVGVVDTNIRRILIHEGFVDEDTSVDKIEEVALSLVPKGKCRDWTNALMDYGALKLTAKKTQIKSVGTQGKFVGSTRYIRSMILKESLKSGYCLISKMEKECEKYNLNLKEILDKMIVQNMIKIDGDEIKIKE